MNKRRLDERVQRLCFILGKVEDVLASFASPAFDEDYKVELRPHLTEDAFDKVEQFANELNDRVRRHLKP